MHLLGVWAGFSLLFASLSPPSGQLFKNILMTKPSAVGLKLPVELAVYAFINLCYLKGVYFLSFLIKTTNHIYSH